MKKPYLALALMALVAAALVPAVSFAEDFVPLTSIPGIGEVTTAATLPAFLNSLYMLSVGAAAVLAVLQIVRGGITYMLSDAGVTEKREAKHHILMAILGLVLVLSPAVVFGIINRDILDLSIDVSGLQPGDLDNVTIPTDSIGNPLSTGNGIRAGTRLSCLYASTFENRVSGKQGNQPAVVLEDERATEGRSLGDGNNLLRVRFEFEDIARYVAAGDCQPPREEPEPEPEVRELGGFRVGQMIYCAIGTSNPQQPYRRVNVTSIANNQYLALSCQGCQRVLVTPDRCSRTIPANVCGAPPSCVAGCELSSDEEGADICEPV